MLRKLVFRARTWWPIWYHVLNHQTRRLLHDNLPNLDDSQQEILQRLRTTGIATTSLDALFPGEDWLPRLTSFVEQHRSRTTINPVKPFLEMFWAERPALDPHNPFVQLSIHHRALAVANSYMGMYCKLNYYHLARTVPVGDQAARKSQRWHRDPEEPRMVKMFVYLNDVDETAGPFIYIPRTAPGQKWGHLFPQRPPNGSYPREEAIERLLQQEQPMVMTGTPGTVIFCDTTGLHRGGYATAKERLMFTAFYTSPWWSDPQRYQHTAESNEYLRSLEPTAKYALEHASHH